MKSKTVNIIGISGKAGAGKDEVAKIIQHLTSSYYPEEYLEYKEEDKWKIVESPWENKKFSAKLKQMAVFALGVPVERLEDREFKEKHRNLLIYIGNTMREYDPDFWVNALFKDYECINDAKRASMGNVIDYSDCEFPKWIISDVRYLNEVEAITSRGGIVMRIDRIYDNVLIMNDLYTATDWQDISETSLDNYDKFDYYVKNKSTILNLVYEVESILKKEQIIP